ncbi:CRAL/TRIO domain-containing protein [Marasmius fiardii PR-910]|nr:CRAL/TRIO domain-containing protein [Marasmius fiardii PR-910]
MNDHLHDLKQAIENDHPGSSHDDPTLLRFLRARRFDVKLAHKQFSDTQRWRKEHDVDNLFANFPIDEFENSKRFYPRWTGRRDNDGHPLYVYRLASIASLQQEIHSAPPQRRYQRIVALYEIMTRFVLPLCTFLPHKSSEPISSVVTIIDLEKVSFGTMWGLRDHLQEASKLATANYPETLHTIAVVNSPSFFPTIWRWISGWFDEGTRKKIHVLGTDPGPVLRGLINPVHLPAVYGGELDWQFENEPSLDDPAKQAIHSMPKGPSIFVDGNVQRPT